MTRLILALALLALPVSALAFTDNPRAASADSLISGAVPVHGTLQGDEIQCAGVCGFMLHRVFPIEATGGAVQVYINRYTPDATPSNRLCDQVCLGVVKPGQSISDLDVTSCTLTATDPLATQNQLLRTNLLSVTPHLSNGLGTLCGACPGPDCCGGGDLYIEVNRLGVCAGGATPSSNAVNYTSMTLGFQ